MHLKAVDCQLQMSLQATLVTYPWPYFQIPSILHNKEKVWSEKYRRVPKKNKQAPNLTIEWQFCEKRRFKFRSNYLSICNDMLSSKNSVF